MDVAVAEVAEVANGEAVLSSWQETAPKPKEGPLVPSDPSIWLRIISFFPCWFKGIYHYWKKVYIYIY